MDMDDDDSGGGGGAAFEWEDVDDDVVLMDNAQLLAGPGPEDSGDLLVTLGGGCIGLGAGWPRATARPRVGAAPTELWRPSMAVPAGGDGLLTPTPRW